MTETKENGMERYSVKYALECKFWEGWETVGTYKSFDKANEASQHYRGHQRLYIWEQLYDGKMLIGEDIVNASG